MLDKLCKITGLLSRYIGLIIIITSTIAFFKPAGFAWATTYTPTFLGVAMFGMGLTIQWTDLKDVYRNKKYVALGCLAQYTIMPLLAWALCVVFKLPTDLAIGCILVGCCPGGTASNVITYIAKGDTALSVSMTTVSTLIAPVVTPALVALLAGAYVEVSFMAMLISLVKMILVPVAAGIALNTFFHRQVAKVNGVLPLISVVAIVMIIAGIVAVNNTKILESGIFVLAIVLIHNICGLLLGLVLGKVTGMKKPVATAVSIEIAMQNSGLAASLASIHFAANPLATLPGAIFSVVQNMTGSIFASLRNGGKDEDMDPDQEERKGFALKEADAN